MGKKKNLKKTNSTFCAEKEKKLGVFRLSGGFVLGTELALCTGKN
jgi:hypothetical protein